METNGTENSKKEMSWKIFGESLASDILQSREHTLKAMRTGLICVTILATVTVIGLIAVNCLQSKRFIDYLSQYDFVSQDGEGYNYYNSDVGGSVINGSENKETEKQEKGKGNGSQEEEEVNE